MSTTQRQSIHSGSGQLPTNHIVPPTSLIDDLFSDTGMMARPSPPRALNALWAGSQVVTGVAEKQVLKTVARTILSDQTHLLDGLPIKITVEGDRLQLECTHHIELQTARDLASIKIDRISACLMLRENPRVVALGTVDSDFNTKVLVFNFSCHEDASVFVDSIRTAFLANMKAQQEMKPSPAPFQHDRSSTPKTKFTSAQNSPRLVNQTHLHQNHYGTDSLLLPTTAGLFQSSAPTAETSLLDCYY